MKELTTEEKKSLAVRQTSSDYKLRIEKIITTEKEHTETICRKNDKLSQSYTQIDILQKMTEKTWIQIDKKSNMTRDEAISYLIEKYEEIKTQIQTSDDCINVKAEGQIPNIYDNLDCFGESITLKLTHNNTYNDDMVEYVFEVDFYYGDDDFEICCFAGF